MNRQDYIYELVGKVVKKDLKKKERWEHFLAIRSNCSGKRNGQKD